MFAIEARNITKHYRLNKALNDFNLQVAKGSVFALLGPNGAGKTTFIKCMLGLVNFSSGELQVEGQNVKSVDARKLISYIPERFNFYSFYTTTAVLEFYAKAMGVNKDEIPARIEKALEKLDLLEIRDKKISDMSKGQRQRVGIANLVLSDAPILILDEPFSGLDPIGIKDLKNIIKEFKDQGKTVFLNSHILSEVEEICDEFAVINKGVCHAQGKKSELLKNIRLDDFFYQTIKGETNISADEQEIVQSEAQGERHV